MQNVQFEKKKKSTRKCDGANSSSQGEKLEETLNNKVSSGVDCCEPPLEKIFN